MRQVQEFKIGRALARMDAKAIPERARRMKTRRELRAFQTDVDIAYAALVQRVHAHNVAACAYAPRASPVFH
jgi:hypothetical protein